MLQSVTTRSIATLSESHSPSVAIQPENSFADSTIENKQDSKTVESSVFFESACPVCGGTLEWLSRFDKGVWKCSGCSPALHASMIAETRERACYVDFRPVFDPITICAGKQVCKCGGRWLDMTMNGYRCGCCSAPISMSADQIFWSFEDFSSLNGGVKSVGNERVFAK